MRECFEIQNLEVEQAKDSDSEPPSFPRRAMKGYKSYIMLALRRDLVTCEVPCVPPHCSRLEASTRPFGSTCKRTNHSCHCCRHLDQIKPRDTISDPFCVWTTSLLSQVHLCSLCFADLLLKWQGT